MNGKKITARYLMKRYTVHGAFKNKSLAKKREKKVHGFILSRIIKGKKRYVVLRKK